MTHQEDQVHGYDSYINKSIDQDDSRHMLNNDTSHLLSKKHPLEEAQRAGLFISEEKKNVNGEGAVADPYGDDLDALVDSDFNDNQPNRIALRTKPKGTEMVQINTNQKDSIDSDGL